MATKWNNIKSKIKNFFMNGGDKLILWSILTCIGLFFNLHSVDNFNYIFALSVLFYCLSVYPLYQYYLFKKYNNWFPVNEDFYASWKKQNRHSYQTILIYIIIKYILLTSIIFTFEIAYSEELFIIHSLVSIFLECATWLLLIRHFMTGKLDDLIACMANIQQHNLDVAIQSEKMKVDLISNVSHDLKTPLTSMIGYIDLIKKEELTPVITDYMTALSAKTEKLKEMIESLFSLAKTSSGNIKLNLEPVKINRLVEQIYADMEEQIQASNLEFISELTVQDTEIMTDSSYIYRIFQNLIENSLKYSANYTRIYIKTSIIELSDTKTVHFELTNTANYRMNFAKDQIIERFTRGDTARTGDGNGLGLAIVSTYTSALGGRFDVLIDCDQFKAILDFDKVPTDTLAQQLYEMEV